MKSIAKNTFKMILAALLALALLCGACTAEALLEMVSAPQPGSIGGEWAVLALARGNFPTPDGYYEGYMNRVEEALDACGGVLHPVKRTEYARTALALAALGEDPADFRGYDLLAPLTDVQAVKLQGNNGPIWALIALDSGDYADMEEAREALLAEIISAQNGDGGYAIAAGGASNVDMTAMALTALSRHLSGAAAKGCAERALEYLSGAEISSCESWAQLLLAYSTLGMRQEAAQAREGMEAYAIDGGYRHDFDQQTADGMASEQAAYAAVAYERMLDGRNALFDMRNVK